MRVTWPRLVAAALSLGGCGAAPRGTAGAAGDPTLLEPIHVQASRDGERIDLDAYDAAGLFQRAAVALRAGRCDTAVELYRKLIDEFPAAELVPPSQYNSGLCLDQLGRFQEAAAAYGALIERFPESRDVTDALFRLVGSYEQLEAWDDVVAAADRLLLERDDLRGIERVEALARKGAALAASGREAEARLALEEAVRLYRAGRGIAPSDSVFHYSMAQFKLGELLHNEMRAVALPSDEAALEGRLEHKAQLLLDAQRTYTKVIRIGHPHWAAAAAYRIGALYQHLWVDILDAPPPADLSAEEQAIYFDILRDRIRVLLRKAVVQWERTLKLAVRLGLDNEWIARTTADLAEIREVLVIEATEEDAEPGEEKK